MLEHDDIVSFVTSLGLLIRSKLSMIKLEELIWLSWMFPGDIMESRRRDIISLALTYKTVVL